MVDETLRAEAREQALSDPLLEMQVNSLFGEHAGILEHDRADGRLAAPVGELLVLLAGSTEGVERRGPTRIGLRAAVEPRECPDRPTCSSVPSLSGSAPRSSREQDSASRNGAASNPVQVREASKQASAALDLRLQVLLALARRLQLFLGNTLLLCVEVGPLDLASQLFGVAVPDALAQSAFDVVVDHLRKAAELLLDGLRLSDQHLEHPVLDPLGEHEVMAAHFGSRLELSVDAAVPLLDSARIPGQVEMEEICAMRLKVQALACRIGRKQDAQRVLGGIGVEPTLDLLAPCAAGEAVDHLDPLVGAVSTLDRLLEDRFQIALSAFAILRENKDAPIVPFGR